MTRPTRAVGRPARRSASLEGPPQGRGHYSEDGRHWWDEDQGRWFPSTGGEDRLEIEVEEVPLRPLRRFTNAVVRHDTTLRYRFVGRAHSDDPRWPVYAITSEPFVVPVPSDARTPPAPTDPSIDGMTARLWDLERTLVEHGWLPRGRHTHWWSSLYVRPTLDWEAPREVSHS